MTVIWLAAGGVLGTLARYVLATRIGDLAGSTALGIFAVNIIGALAIGVFLGLAESREHWSREAHLFVATGFLGAFTTFSALAWQTYQFLDLRDAPAALANMAGTALVGLAAVYAGVALARLVP